MLSGEKDSQTISKIISANKGIGKYFANFLDICESVMLNEQFTLLTLGVLLEILYINRKESFEHPMIMSSLLVELGDNNSMFTGNLSESKPEWMKRGVTYELCMLSADFTCVVCRLLFDTTTE